MNIVFLNHFKNNLDFKEIGFYLFLIGLFLLPSATSISYLFLLSSAIIGSTKRKESFLMDRWNINFLITGILMIISTIFSYKYNLSIIKNPSEISGIWLDLFNWLPFIWLFWAFQPYLTKLKQRIICMKIFICGSIPVLVSGFLQVWGKIYGPMETLNGLIIWYQRPLSDQLGLSGLFNNQNYAAAWLSFILPFCIVSYANCKGKFYQKGMLIIINFFVFIALILTISRVAFINIIFTFPFLFGIKIISWYLPFTLGLITFFLIYIFYANLPFVNNIFSQIIPERLLFKIESIKFSQWNSILRFNIWIFTGFLIFKRPIFGYGANTFPILFQEAYQRWQGHTHNIFLELCQVYGIPIALVILVSIIILIRNSLIKIPIYGKKKSLEKIDLYFERAWFAAFFLLIISNNVDITYFDSRISISIWVLLSGIRARMAENKYLS